MGYIMMHAASRFDESVQIFHTTQVTADEDTLHYCMPTNLSLVSNEVQSREKFL